MTTLTEEETAIALKRLCATKGSKKAHIFKGTTSGKTLCGQPFYSYGYAHHSTYHTLKKDDKRWPISEDGLCKSCRNYKDAVLVLAALKLQKLPAAVRTVMVLNVRVRKEMTMVDLVNFADEVKTAAHAMKDSPVDAVEVKLTSY